MRARRSLGRRWARDEVRAEHLDPSTLRWDMRRRFDLDAVPDRRVVIEFRFRGVTRGPTGWWLTVTRADVDECLSDPGFGVDLIVAGDVTPELLAAGAAGGGPAEKVEWVEAEARSLPFAVGEFDGVASCIGAMFAPDHRAVAAELVRVCRPGGRLGMINWTPHGSTGGFFAVFAGPPVGPAPIDWGSAEYVRSLFGERAALTFAEASLPVDVFAGPEEYCASYKAHFGPTIAAFAAAADPDALDRAFLDHATAADHGGGHFEYEYLLVTGRTAG
jgi:SAM-dependent methyltransferase